MSKDKIYPVPRKIRGTAHINENQYLAMYEASVTKGNEFWAQKADEFITWFKPWQKVNEYDSIQGHTKWFIGAELNASYNCIDRHLELKADQTAIIWESDNPSENVNISYRQLHQHVCRLSNVLLQRGVKKGDRVCIYMPMIPEAAYAMLACARIGAVHSVVFGGFSPQALKDRILDSDCRTVITADEGIRGGKTIPLKDNVDTALNDCPATSTVLVVKRTGGDIQWIEGRDVWYEDAVKTASPDCPPVPMSSEDPLFILYTSGSTGKPKGVLHTTGGYLLQASITHKYVFNYQDGDVYWCTADVGLSLIHI